MQINWTNCSDHMPPDDDREIIIRRVGNYHANSNNTNELILTPANEIGFDIDISSPDYWQWTEFTQEKLEFLSNDYDEA